MVELLLLGQHERAGRRYRDAQVNLCVMLAANLWRAGEVRTRAALPGFPWVADLLMSFPEGTNEGYGPIFSDSGADRALVC